MMQRFVVVGGGVAGHRAVVELARRAPDATIDLVSEEACLPYDRPPVSKELLHGSKTAEQILLNGAAVYEQANIRYHAGTRITAIDGVHRTVVTREGAEFAFDRLLLATGSRPRRLPPACVGDVVVHYLRTVQDGLALQQQLIAGRRVAIIGGGFIGLEVAAAAIRRGCRVTILESQSCLLARGMPILVSEWVDRLHRAEGVEIMLSASVIAMQQEKSGISIMGSGWTIEADIVVAGIGAEPNVELAVGAGLEVGNGLVVDAHCRTSDPEIYGAGEVTCHPVMHGVPRRIESWRSSSEQGTVAAQAMTGEAVVFDEIPTLWSDQFNANIQSVGFPDLGVEYQTIGDPASNSWTLVSLGEDGSIMGGIAINRGRDASVLKRAVRNKAGMPFMQPRVA
jgi:NADPH-dependent 2,4-dienoyl-CoA reductase/sulfur reductase-like enzyme